jgi:hypothetical protein
MQYLLGFVALIAALVFILYKVNNQFEKREFFILLAILALAVIGFNLYSKKQENYFPELFKEHYYNKHNIQIEQLSYKLLNNQHISSKNKYIYSFTYIVNKDNTSYLCTAKEVVIRKIEKTFVFNDWSEECQIK